MPKEIVVKSVLNKKKQRDSWFLDEYTFNPYSSCSFNCLYCYIRGSKYGKNLEQSLSVKINAIELLDKQLTTRARKQQYGFIVISSATDPYLKIEKEYGLTRKALQVVLKHRFPVHIITKSDLVSRDFDLLKEIDERAILPSDLSESLGRGTLISFSFSTLDDGAAAIFEPGAVKPSTRLEAVKDAQQAGFLSGISMMPLIPYITDTETSLHQLFSTFKICGVHYVLPASITLFGSGKADSRTLVMNAVTKHYPALATKYANLFRHCSEMPPEYLRNFYKRTSELCKEYGIRSKILDT